MKQGVWNKEKSVSVVQRGSWQRQAPPPPLPPKDLPSLLHNSGHNKCNLIKTLKAACRKFEVKNSLLSYAIFCSFKIFLAHVF